MWYQNFPIQNPDFSQTWYLNNIYYEFDPEVIVSEINPPISPTFIVDGVNFLDRQLAILILGLFHFFQTANIKWKRFPKQIMTVKIKVI